MNIHWNHIEQPDQLDQIRAASFQQPQIIFKHSTRCSISSLAKSRLEKQTPPANTAFHYLDLIRFRELSNRIAADFQVYHESPQVLVIKNGDCIYDESHLAISMEEITEQVA